MLFDGPQDLIEHCCGGSDRQGRQIMKKILLIAILMLLMAPAAVFAYGHTLNIAPGFGGAGSNSGGPTLGLTDWLVWKYDNHSGTDNWLLQLPYCYIASPDLFNEIEASNGHDNDGGVMVTAGGSNNFDSNHFDSNSGFKGLKQDWEDNDNGHNDDKGNSGCGDFWFTNPKGLDIDKDGWGGSCGNDGYDHFHWPKHDDHNGGGCGGGSGVPEPLSLILFGSGLLGTAFLKREKGKG